MSFDVYFVPRDQPIDESMEALEQRTLAGPHPLTDEDERIWAAIVARVEQVFSVTAGRYNDAGTESLRLEDPDSLVRLVMFGGGELSLHTPHWYDACCTGATRGAAMQQIAAGVTAETGLAPHDPQTGGWFTPLSVQWFDHDQWGGPLVTFVSPEPSDLTALRGAKTPDGRRRLGQSIAARSAPEWMVQPVRNTAKWLVEAALGREPYEPKRDQIALTYGQRMHKKNGFRLDLIRNVPELLVKLHAVDGDSLRSSLTEFQDPTWLDTRLGRTAGDDYRASWKRQIERIDHDAADALVDFHGNVVDLFERAEAAQRKVLTVQRWPGWFRPIQAP